MSYLQSQPKDFFYEEADLPSLQMSSSIRMDAMVVESNSQSAVLSQASHASSSTRPPVVPAGTSIVHVWPLLNWMLPLEGTAEKVVDKSDGMCNGVVDK